MNLEQIRLRIDKIDDEILGLILKRIEYSKLVAKIKLKENASICDEKREIEILKRLQNLSNDNFRYISSIFSEILNSSKRIQEEILNNK